MPPSAGGLVFTNRCLGRAQLQHGLFQGGHPIHVQNLTHRCLSQNHENLGPWEHDKRRSKPLLLPREAQDRMHRNSLPLHRSALPQRSSHTGNILEVSTTLSYGAIHCSFAARASEIEPTRGPESNTALTLTVIARPFPGTPSVPSTCWV